MAYIKKNLLSIMAIVISVIAIFLTCFRIDPIDFNNGTVIAFVVGLMGVCATIMVASQIMGLRISEMKVKSMLNDEAEKIRCASQTTTTISLFRIEVIAANMAIEKQEWDVFISRIELLISYALDIKSEKKANEISKILIESEVGFKFSQYLSKDDGKRLRDSILTLIKLMDDDPTTLLRLFNVLHTIE